MKLGVVAVAIAAVAATGCGSSHHASKAIAYTKFVRGGGEEVWIAAPDGSQKRRLARGGSPQLSPDGRWVAFRKPCGRPRRLPLRRRERRRKAPAAGSERLSRPLVF